MVGKAAILQMLNRRAARLLRALPCDKHTFAGFSPPSLFVGRVGYPMVAAGPLVGERIDELHHPESCLRRGASALQVASRYLALIRAKRLVNVKERSRYVDALREIALASPSPWVEVFFKTRPMGSYFCEEAQPFGPSAPIETIAAEVKRFDQRLEKFFYDGDATAKAAALELHSSGVATSAIARALSAGCLGLESKRKLVPTRWSITAIDATLSQSLIEEIRAHNLIDRCLVYEHESLSNRFLVVLLPMHWCFEWVEAFFPSAQGESLAVFSDREHGGGKRNYSIVGGCYYAARLAIVEKLAKEKIQAGALVLREAYEDYIPLGVWNVRENVRAALNNAPMQFNSTKNAFVYALSRLRLQPRHWLAHSTLLRNALVHGLRLSTQLRLTNIVDA